jgi:folate-binding protein YgfZ
MDVQAAPDDELEAELIAIDRGRAFARPNGVRILRVTGSDAGAWLHDLITTDVASLVPGQARHSLLLSPTGRIRADFMVCRDREGYWLFQSMAQREALDVALSIYVLSSDVEVTEVSADHDVWTLVGDADRHAGGLGWGPSIVGPGRDLVAARDAIEPPWAVTPLGDLPELQQVAEDALEIWRIRRGDPRMGADFDEGALPAEAGLDATIDATKGCFLGQESVAKIRNMGHPPTLLRHVTAEEVAISVGSRVFDGDSEVGIVTSAAPAAGGGSVALVRVAWPSRTAPITAAEGSRFLPVHRED